MARTSSEHISGEEVVIREAKVRAEDGGPGRSGHGDKERASLAHVSRGNARVGSWGVGEGERGRERWGGGGKGGGPSLRHSTLPIPLSSRFLTFWYDPRLIHLGELGAKPVPSLPSLLSFLSFRSLQLRQSPPRPISLIPIYFIPLCLLHCPCL